MPPKTPSAGKSRVLITGGAGYIGSILSEVLLNEGFHVTVLDSFIYRQASLLNWCASDQFEVIRGDCRDQFLMREALKNKEIVIPLAAIVGAPACDRDRIAAESTNVGAIELLLKLSSKNQMILYPTTNSGYGIGQRGMFCTEKTPLKPISFYGTTKVHAENLIHERGNSISFRLATVFGASPRMRVDLLVNDFVARAVSDRAVIVFEGHFKRNYIHIRDVAKAFLHGIKNFSRMKNEIYNVGLENANLSKIELCRKIQKIIPKFIFLEAPIGEDPDKRNYIVSNKKILATGFKPDRSVEEGIKELMKCYALISKSSWSRN